MKRKRSTGSDSDTEIPSRPPTLMGKDIEKDHYDHTIDYYDELEEEDDTD